KLQTVQRIETASNSQLLIAITACFIFLAFDGIVLDMLNFRHLWVLVAILGCSKGLLDTKT
ncbi:MAG TPA: hypothetical protein VMZ69_02185, partial [Saprospiraceae bacterium]|nr:hypothetical protein [Saprospiraceae bacterium]